MAPTRVGVERKAFGGERLGQGSNRQVTSSRVGAIRKAS